MNLKMIKKAGILFNQLKFSKNLKINHNNFFIIIYIYIVQLHILIYIYQINKLI